MTQATDTTQTPAPGIYPGVPFATYHAWPAWGSSDLKAMRKGPPVMVSWGREQPHEDTAATILGTAAHCAIIEPERFRAIYEHKPEGLTFSSLQGKAWRDDPCRAGKVLLAHDQWVAVEGIVAAFDAKVPAAASIAGAHAREASIVWAFEGETLKGRPDWFDFDCVVDLKISIHANAGEWIGARAHAMGWMHQLSHYRAGLRANGVPVRTGRIVLIQPTAPHLVFTLEVKESALDLLDYDNESTIRRLAECRVTGVWPGTADSWTKLDIPPSELAKGVEITGAMENEDA